MEAQLELRNKNEEESSFDLLLIFSYIGNCVGISSPLSDGELCQNDRNKNHCTSDLFAGSQGFSQ